MINKDERTKTHTVKCSNFCNVYQKTIEWVSKHPVQFSFAFSVFLFILPAVTGVMKFEVSDDFMMEAIVSGQYGGTPSAYIMFMSPLLGVMFQGLYSLSRLFNWYVWFQIIVIIFSSTAILKVALESGNSRCVFGGFAVALLISLDGYQLMQFTKTAAFSICAGFSLYYHYYIYRDSKRDLWCGTALVLVGTLIRFAVFFICAAMYILLLVITLVFYKKGKDQIRRALIAGLLAICSLLSVLVIREVMDLSSSYSEFREYSSIRAEIVDYPHPEYSEIQDQLTEIGFDEDEYNMVFNWLFADSDEFSLEKMEDLKEVLRSYREKKNIKNILKDLAHQKYWLFASFWVCLVIFLLSLTAGVKPALVCATLCVGGILLLIYNGFQGRLVYRVDFCIFFALSCVMKDFLSERYVRKEPHFLVLFFLYSLLFGTRLFYLIPNFSSDRYEIMNYSWANDLRKYRYAFSPKDTEDLNDFILNSGDFFYFDFNTGIQRYYLSFPILSPLPNDAFDNLIYLCGVDYLHPARQEKIDQFKLNGGLTDLLRDDVYLIDNESVLEIEKFLEKETGTDVTAEPVTEADGFTIWKLYEENE